MIRRDAWRDYSRGSLWVLPLVSVVLAPRGAKASARLRVQQQLIGGWGTKACENGFEKINRRWVSAVLLPDIAVLITGLVMPDGAGEVQASW